MAVNSSPLGRVISRRVNGQLDEALSDTRVVLIQGARQCGKSTLARAAAKHHGIVWTSLDNGNTLTAALTDPARFVQRAPKLAIDEVQRAPELILAIKEVVDSQFVPGNFLLTGSSRVMNLKRVKDALPGRVETVELWPLSQGEIDNTSDGFIDAAFKKGFELQYESETSWDDYARRIARGGFPQAVARESRRRKRFHQEYLADLLNRDILQVAELERPRELRSLVQLLAARTGTEFVVNRYSREIGISPETIRRYLGLLEELYLVKRIPAWSRNLGTRLVSVPKVAMVDSGLATSVLGLDEMSMERLGAPVGGLFEGFVAMELMRQASWADREVNFFHYRTRDQVEVDLVLEDPLGKVVAIEVKAAQSLRTEDFRGLRHLRDRLGDDFLAGYVLYAGKISLPFGSKLAALPIAAVWGVEA